MQDPSDPELRQPDASVAELRAQIEAIIDDRALLQRGHARAVREVVYRLDQGELRVAERVAGPERWTVHGWIQQSISFYFAIAHVESYQAGDLEFHDKVPPKHRLAAAGVRVVPPGVVRYGAHVEKGAIVMPGYVNIGARVGAGTMVDTWATVGSCAQVGRSVHLSGGVGLGGVLEPPGARPVIVEDGAFIGSRCIVVEGCLVEEEAVLGAGVVLTASTPIHDVTGREERVLKGRVPARSVVIPGMRPRKFPAGEYLTPCALIIGQRSESTDQKTSLNQALRDFGVSV
ncbi:MAG TPA: 2,3,4,5-tetrahydropyridine-2,6-dicarboxylate N-succinyltransferase [Myxococcales bacterium]|nr:2,3,4,5-tetrahydropyridine-2,6-dicarboxylate N-succinyltransferase [Myxococcales bacterium]